MSSWYGPALPSKVDPEALIIAFDLHRVVFHRNFLATFTYLMRLHHKGRALALALNPRIWSMVMQLRQETTVGDEIFDKLIERYPSLARFEQDYINLENTQMPDGAVVDIIQELKQKKFTLYILSNIGHRAYADLSKKFSFIFSLFDHVYLPTKAHNYLQKPHEPFYHNFLAYAAEMGDGGKQVLFIDDKVPNLVAAALCGISGIHFCSAHQLKNLLHKLLLV